jgi:hypothetical protein
MNPMAILRGHPEEMTTAFNSVAVTNTSMVDRIGSDRDGVNHDGTERPNFIDALRDLTVRH